MTYTNMPKKSRSRCYSFARSRAQAHFDTAVNQVARDVHRRRKISICRYYRPLEANEEAQARRSLSLVGLLGSSPLGAEIFAIFVLGWFSVPCLIAIFDALVLPARFNGVFKACLRDGVVNVAVLSNAITGIVLSDVKRDCSPQRCRVAVSCPMEPIIGLCGLVWCSRSGHKGHETSNIQLEKKP